MRIWSDGVRVLLRHHPSPAIDIPLRSAGDLDRLRNLARSEHNAKQRDRYRAAILAIEQRPTAAIVDAIGRSRSFIQRWAYAYRDEGIEAIRAKSPTGRKPKLNAEQQERFLARVDAGPLETDPVCTLRGPDFQRILKEEFEAVYSLSGVYTMLERHAYSCLRPRPQHQKSDPEAQEQWVKGAPFLSRKSGSSTPSSG